MPVPGLSLGVCVALHGENFSCRGNIIVHGEEEARAFGSLRGIGEWTRGFLWHKAVLPLT